MKYVNLFSEKKIGNLYAKNRIVMSAMGEEMANVDGSVCERGVAYYEERAKGGVGIIIPGVLSVDYPTGKTTGLQHRLDDPRFIAGWHRMANVVHHYGALLIPQIHHAGAQTNSITAEGNTPVCVSDTDEIEHSLIRYYRPFGPQHELTTDEIRVLVQKFIQTAVYAQMAHCDGVEIHAGHGYLVNQFLSADTNKRTDEYGGSLENRMRFLMEIIKGIRERCGRNFIVGARIPGKEWTKNGLSEEECLAIAAACEKEGCDFLDVTGGMTVLTSTIMETQGYPEGARVQYAAAIKKTVNIPVFTVGNLREPAFCENVIAQDRADFVCLGRPLIADPYWPVKAQEGREEEIRKCISCCNCFSNVLNHLPVDCTINPNAGYECDFKADEKADESKKVLVIGGGPAGMQAAITAKKRGHQVTLVEKSDKLGGQLKIACVPPNKYPIEYEINNLVKEIEREKVDIHLNMEATPEYVDSLKPDTIIAASGSTPATPPIAGVENTIQSWDLLNGSVPMPKNEKITMIGGGIVACETALMLAKEGGNNVVILEMLPTIANGLETTHLGDLMKEFAELGVQSIVNAQVQKIEKDSVTYKADGRDEVIQCDCSVLATGQRPFGLDLVKVLKKKGYKVVTVGDAVRPRRIIEAVREGNAAAYQI